MDETFTIPSSNEYAFDYESDSDPAYRRLSFSSALSEVPTNSKKVANELEHDGTTTGSQATSSGSQATSSGSQATGSFPPFTDMIVKAVENSKDRKGASVPSIKSYLIEYYNVNEAKMKRNLKRSIEKCLAEERIQRCIKKDAKHTTGLSGRFKLIKSKGEKPSTKKAKSKGEKPSTKKAKSKGEKSSARKTKSKLPLPTATSNIAKSENPRRKSNAVQVVQSKVKLAKTTLRKSSRQKPIKVVKEQTSIQPKMPVSSVNPIQRDKKFKKANQKAKKAAIAAKSSSKPATQRKKSAQKTKVKSKTTKSKENVELSTASKPIESRPKRNAKSKKKSF